jgi:hypothetical protein
MSFNPPFFGDYSAFFPQVTDHKTPRHRRRLPLRSGQTEFVSAIFREKRK